MAGPADWGAVPAPEAPAADGPAAWGAVPAQAQPSVGSDLLHMAGPALVRGTVAAVTAPATVADLAVKGLNYGIDKAATALGHPGYLKALDDVEQFRKNVGKDAGLPSVPMPTYGEVVPTIEKATGPMYEAQTGPGKVAQTAIELAPSVAAGGGTLLQKGAQLAGATAGGKIGEGVGAMVGYPTVGSVIGTILGGGLPNAATPFPQKTARYASDVKTLTDAGVPLTAGRKTGSPFLQKVESGLGPKGDEAADFTKAATKITGSGASNPQDIVNLPRGGTGNALAAQQQALKDGYTQFFGNRQIPYGNLTNDVNSIVQGYKHTAGAQANPIVEEMANAITLGKSGRPMANAQVAGMDGARYQLLKDRFEDAIAAAGGTEKQALLAMKGKMEESLRASMTPQEAQAFDTLNRQYASLRTVAGAKQGPGGTVTPEALRTSASHRVGTEGFNLGKGGEAADLARAGVNVMQPRPTFDSAHTGTAVGTLLGAGAGVPAFLAGAGMTNALDASILGAIVGTSAGHLAGTVGKPLARGLYYNPMVQALVGNQVFGKGGGADKSVMARLLATPPVTNPTPQPSK